MSNTYILKEDLNKWVAKYFTKDLVRIDDLIATIEELDSKVSELEENINDILEDRDTNYKRIDYASQIGE